mmetsp:Transcript_32948/g.70671  ORF Transcript_32948/g.70671 Transcript_32948/m.70671 type:complete len:132 (+) Transcript_32948:54-449(+)
MVDHSTCDIEVDTSRVGYCVPWIDPTNKSSSCYNNNNNSYYNNNNIHSYAVDSHNCSDGDLQYPEAIFSEEGLNVTESIFVEDAGGNTWAICQTAVGPSLEDSEIVRYVNWAHQQWKFWDLEVNWLTCCYV